MDKKIKIAIGMELQEGAFGGGNQYGKLLRDLLISRGMDVTFNLKDDDIDIILLTDPRKWLRSCSFNVIDAWKYIFKKPDTLFIATVHECDERKGTKIKLLNNLLTKSMDLADSIVFISTWQKNIFLKRNKGLTDKAKVILHGADTNIFNPDGHRSWNGQGPLKLVTHHWAGNWWKGFDVYIQLDELMEGKYKGRVEFTYLGNIPKDVRFKNVKVLPPKSGKELAEEIKKNHVYLTASINEPAGMHHIEGALCGLPLLYRESGALPEYCGEYGVFFDGPRDFESKLDEMIVRYNDFMKIIHNYDNTPEKMGQNYYNLFLDLINNKESILQKRNVSKFRIFRYKFLVFGTLILMMAKGRTLNLLEKIKLYKA